MNIRKAWMALLIVLSLGLLISAASAQTVSIADGSADAGATTTVAITADDVTDLANFDITVTYNPAVVNVTSAANDDEFGVAVNNLESAAAGSVRLASINFGAGQTGDGILLSTLTLEAVGTAGQTSAFTLEINELKDSSEGDIAATTDGGVFTVTGEVPAGPVVAISDGSADAGATTTVAITADDVTDLANFDITVTYNPAVVNVTSAANDDEFGVAVNNLESAAAGSVRLASINFGAGQTGDGILLSTLTLEAVGTAGQTSAFTLEINELKDSSEGDIAATTDGGVFTVSAPSAANIVINEFMANPSSGSEWVELYNKETAAVDIGGWKVDDIEGGSSPTTIPADTTIAAGGFYVVTVSGLNNGEDTVRLLDDTGTLVDSHAYTSSTAGVSEGRTTDGADTWTTFTTPTRGASNVVALLNMTVTATPDTIIVFEETDITISVTDESTGAPIDGAIVTLSAGPWSDSNTTIGGECTFFDIGSPFSGTIYVDVTASGYNDDSTTIAVTEAGATVSIGSADNVSGTVNVPISIADASNIGAMDITVTYDASILTATGVADGTMTEDLSNFTSAYDVSEGKLNISFATYPDTINGDGELFVVTFDAAAAGTSMLDITVTGAWTCDESPQSVTVAVENGSVTVTGVAGDMDGSGEVTFDDVILLAKHFYFGDEVLGNPDVDSSGEVTFDDVILLARHFYFGDTLYP